MWSRSFPGRVDRPVSHPDPHRGRRSAVRGPVPQFALSLLCLGAAIWWNGALGQRATAAGEQPPAFSGGATTPADELQRRLAQEEFDPDAMFFLGVMAIQSRTTEGDYEEAADWFARAAEHGHPEALFNLGILYWTGQGVPRDRSRAVFYWRRAAELGFAAAQYNLAAAYINGEGAAVDSREAKYWLDRAAAGGHTEAALALEALDTAR